MDVFISGSASFTCSSSPRRRHWLTERVLSSLTWTGGAMAEMLPPTRCPPKGPEGKKDSTLGHFDLHC